MDGNRRFADLHHLDRLGGHSSGYGKMVDVITWCLEMGVACVSVYAFSIDNYGRPPDEVAGLMKLAEEKYRELLEDGAAARWGAQVRVVGDLSLAPPNVQVAAARLMAATEAHGVAAAGRPIINICFSYTASEELAASVEAARAGVADGFLHADDVDGSLLTSCLRSGNCPPVDLLVRTSAEERLSDFLLAQSSHALLCWLPRLWPDLGYADVARCVLSWQRAAPALHRLRAAAGQRCSAAAAPALAPGADATAAAASCVCGDWCAAEPANLDAEEDGSQLQRCGGVGQDGSGGSARLQLSPIDERQPASIPHPCRMQRVVTFLGRLDELRRAWVQATAAAVVA